MLSRHSVETCYGNKLTPISSGNAQPQLSQLAESLWTKSGLKSGIGIHKLISSLKKKKGGGGQMGIESLNIFPQNTHMRGKSHHHLCEYVFSWLSGCSTG